jgi:uncharacterized protein YjeT (DUF2065 family)
MRDRRPVVRVAAMSLLTILLAGIGLWLLVEGALVALAPEVMRRIAARLAATPASDLVWAGLGAALLGGALVTLAVRTA